MTQENQGTTVAVPNHDLPVKRKRGRPRKDRSQAPPQAQAKAPITSTPTQVQVPITPTPSQGQMPITPIPTQGQVPITTTPTQGQVHIAPTPTIETKNHQRRKLDTVANTKSDMVGQAVFGVLDGSFEAGYLLTVKVGDTDTVLKGVVFQPGSTVPVSLSNDVAPHIRMLKRADIQLPQHGSQQIARIPEYPPATVMQVPPIVPPQLSQVAPIAPPQPSQVPLVAPSHFSQVPPIVPPHVSQVPPIVPPQLSQVPPIVTSQPTQPLPQNDIGGVQVSSQANDILPAHPQPELQHNVTVTNATLPETTQAPTMSEALGNENKLPGTQPSINNNIQVATAEAVTVAPMDIPKDISEGQVSSTPAGGGVPVSNEEATTHGE